MAPVLERARAPAVDAPDPLVFFGHLQWIDGRPLGDVLEPYRARILREALYSFDADGWPVYSLVLTGRAKKNWKTTDLALATLYRFLAWPSPAGNDAVVLANDEDQAGDDLALVKKLIAANAILGREVDVHAKRIVRRDGRGTLKILPAGDVLGAHGRTYLVAAFDEIHGYRDWDLLEALAPDPTRRDALIWITSYASMYNHEGAPLHDLLKAGKGGDDARLYLSWFAADYVTDPAFADLPTGEERANPSQGSWGDAGYLEQQRRRLPAHKYRRLHLNLPGAPTGAAFDPDMLHAAVVPGRRELWPEPQHGWAYKAFCDMSGGSADDACLAVAHLEDDVGVLDCLQDQGCAAPFDPRLAVARFAETLNRYRLTRAVSDAYAGETFKRDFEEHGITLERSTRAKHDIYSAFEPHLNAGEVELLDLPKLQQQALGLVWRGRKIDHQNGEHDDHVNAAAGALVEALHRPSFWVV